MKIPPVNFLIATRNEHKIGEIRAILGGEHRYLSLKDFTQAPAVVEDAHSFAGNATKKSLTLAHWVSKASIASPLRKQDLWVLADDSGLEVDALGGQPGVHSARFASLDQPPDRTHAQAGINAPDEANNAKLLQLLRDVPQEARTARFRCVIALTPVPLLSPRDRSPTCELEEAELRTEIFDGRCEGRIGFAPAGRGGFGYDPLFIPTGYSQSFAQLGEDVKNRMSHRANALQKLRDWLRASH